MAEFSWTLTTPTSEPRGVARARTRGASDVRLFHTPDGGELAFDNGEPLRDQGLETAAYLSLFGGNENDSGLEADNHKQWWGNFGETDDARKYRSRTQHLLRSIPAIPANMRRLEDAAESDLAWMVGSIAQSVQASASIPALNTVRLYVQITIDGRKHVFEFLEAWRVQSVAET